jgi:hypothetical protein
MKTRTLVVLAALFCAPPMLAYAEQSCNDTIGPRASTVLVKDCINVSPATRPPCNAANSCELVLSEILRSCSLYPDIKLCSSYLPMTVMPKSWLGKWTGPEGTAMTITQAGKNYKVKLQSLDGPATYPATYSQNALHFTRNDIEETIRPTDGKGTGMKWLMDKKNCLVIQQSEGFCRN